MRFGLFPLVLFLGAAAGGAAAQEAAPRLPDITVVANPLIEGNQVDDFGSFRTIVTDRQIENLNANDLASALRRTPGVTISRFNPVGSFGGAEGGAVFIRGLGSSRPGAEIKTFIDGVPMYMGVWNHPLLDLLPLTAVERIEVNKGPQPQRFGNALASIDLSTKRVREDGMRTGIRAQGGSYSTFIQQAEHGGRSGALDWYLAQGYQSSDGHRDEGDGRLLNWFGRAGYRIDANWSAGLTVLGVDNRVKDPGPEGQPALRNGQYETRANVLAASLGHDFGWLKGDLKLYYNDGSGDWLRQAGTSGDTLTDFTLYGARARESVMPWEGGEIVAGVDLDYIEGEVLFRPTNAASSRFNSPTFRITSPYAAIAHRQPIGDGWTLTPSAGVRYYDHNQFGSETAPHAGIVAQRGGLTLHAGYARGVNYPGLDVVVFSQNVIPPLGQSWRRLSAERLDHYDAGVRTRLGPHIVADLVAFRQDLDNRYVFVPPPPPPPIFTNLGSSRVRGAEGTLLYQATRDLSLFGGVTYQDPDPSSLPYVPEWTILGGATGRIGAVTYTVDAELVDRTVVFSQSRNARAFNAQEVGSFLVVNARLGYLLPPGYGKQSELFVAVQNLTDRNYQYRPGYPMPGINALAGVSVQF